MIFNKNSISISSSFIFEELELVIIVIEMLEHLGYFLLPLLLFLLLLLLLFVYCSPCRSVRQMSLVFCDIITAIKYMHLTGYIEYSWGSLITLPIRPKSALLHFHQAPPQWSTHQHQHHNVHKVSPTVDIKNTEQEPDIFAGKRLFFSKCVLDSSWLQTFGAKWRSRS